MQREAVTEQESEPEVELGLEQQGDEPPRPLASHVGKLGIDHAAPIVGRSKGHDVHQQDARQGQAAQGVQLLDGGRDLPMGWQRDW